MPPLGHHLRPRAIGLYKELHRLGRDYPDPNYDFIGKLRTMFRKNASLTDDKEIKEKLDLGDFVRKGAYREEFFDLTKERIDQINQHPYPTETETLYSLKKYRTLRRRYIQDD